MPKPLVIELFAGRFGWGKGFVAEGYKCIGFDIVHEQWHRPVPPGCELVLQDVLTLHGSQLKDASAIVASPPCQKYSWMAMPWDRSKREIRWQQWMRDSPLSPGFHLNDLFDACFRIQREASEAKGEYIPMVVENVKGAQPWVGRAKWHFGSFYLYGDVPALMPVSRKAKVSGLNWSGSDEPGYVAQAFNGTAAKSLGEGLLAGIKHPGYSGRAWFAAPDVAGHLPSNSPRRKAASAAIAEIPFELASHIARVFYPSAKCPITGTFGSA